jgi:(2Fe-2S) ferredoxin
MKPRDLSQPVEFVRRPMPATFSGNFGVTVCVNERPPGTIATVSCGPRGGGAIAESILAELERRNLRVRVSTIKCLGMCEIGPNVRLTPSNSWCHGAHVSDVGAIVDLIEDQLREAGAPE